MGILNSFLGFSQNNNLIKLTSKAEEGWKDLVFSITKKEKLENGFWSLTCKADYNNVIVGLKIKIKDGIPAGIINNEMEKASFTKQGVELLSIGKESDNLIKAISELYEQPKKLKFTSNKLSLTVFPLNQEKAVLENGQFKFKLFFDEKHEQNLYSEIFLNINLKNGIIELNEKDEEYRMNIVKLLSEK